MNINVCRDAQADALQDKELAGSQTDKHVYTHGRERERGFHLERSFQRIEDGKHTKSDTIKLVVKQTNMYTLENGREREREREEGFIWRAASRELNSPANLPSVWLALLVNHERNRGIIYTHHILKLARA